MNEMAIGEEINGGAFGLGFGEALGVELDRVSVSVGSIRYRGSFCLLKSLRQM